MDERERTILRKARVTLIKNLTDVTGLCDKLFSYGVLTENMLSEIMMEGPTNNQVRKLLDIVPRRGKDAYGFLHQALVETGQQEMADMLKPELASRPKDDNYLEQKEIHEASNVLPEPEASHREQHHQHIPLPPFDPETHKPLEIKLQKCNKHEILERQGIEMVYKLDSKPRGKIYIVNITTFEDHEIPSRDEDAHNVSATSITTLFKKLNFKVETKNNISAMDLLNLIKKEQTSTETYDCVAMVILTHGTDDLIFMADGQPLKVQNILEEFNSEKCPNLKGKPKLFFIHACPSDVEHASSVDMNSLFPTNNEESHRLTKGDIFLARAVRYDPIITGSGESKGFRFIQAFVHVMNSQAHLDHLQNIVTKMNSLAEEDQQLVETTHTLTKKLYFFPE